MTLKRAIDIALEEARRFEENAELMASEAQDPEGKCAMWADVYREKARALRLVVERVKEGEMRCNR